MPQLSKTQKANVHKLSVHAALCLNAVAVFVALFPRPTGKGNQAWTAEEITKCLHDKYSSTCRGNADIFIHPAILDRGISMFSNSIMKKGIELVLRTRLRPEHGLASIGDGVPIISKLYSAKFPVGWKKDLPDVENNLDALKNAVAVVRSSIWPSSSEPWDEKKFSVVEIKLMAQSVAAVTSLPPPPAPPSPDVPPPPPVAAVAPQQEVMDLTKGRKLVPYNKLGPRQKLNRQAFVFKLVQNQYTDDSEDDICSLLQHAGSKRKREFDDASSVLASDSPLRLRDIVPKQFSAEKSTWVQELAVMRSKYKQFITEIPERRQQYTNKVKGNIVKCVNIAAAFFYNKLRTGTDAGVQEQQQAAKAEQMAINTVHMHINTRKGYEHLEKRSVSLRLQQSKIPRKKRGRKLNLLFDADVWAKLIVCRVMPKEKPQIPASSSAQVSGDNARPPQRNSTYLRMSAGGQVYDSDSDTDSDINNGGTDWSSTLPPTTYEYASAASSSSSSSSSSSFATAHPSPRRHVYPPRRPITRSHTVAAVVTPAQSAPPKVTHQPPPQESVATTFEEQLQQPLPRGSVASANEDIVVLHNCTFSHAIIHEAIRDVAQSDEWKDDPRIRTLKFSSRWITDFIARQDFSRRRVGTNIKVRPTDLGVNACMAAAAAVYKRRNMELKHVFNADETGLTYAIAPIHIIGPKNQKQTKSYGDLKSRVTAIPMVNALGQFAPTMVIIRHSKSSIEKPDQTTMRVLDKLHEQEGFKTEEGWDLKVWNRVMVIERRGIIKTQNQVVKYLIHNKSGNVVTSQHKAWNDQIRYALWLDVIVKPIRDRLGKMMIWVDNAGPHKTAAVEAILKELDIDCVCYPPNMTDILQVLDLIVNKPIKDNIRRIRALVIYKEFQLYQEKVRAEPSQAKRDALEFTPKAPTLKEGVLSLFDFMASKSMTDTSMANSINKSFIDTGTAPNTEGEWKKYKSKGKSATHGTAAIIPTGTYRQLDFTTEPSQAERDVLIDALIDAVEATEDAEDQPNPDGTEYDEGEECYFEDEDEDEEKNGDENI